MAEFTLTSPDLRAQQFFQLLTADLGGLSNPAETQQVMQTNTNQSAAGDASGETPRPAFRNITALEVETETSMQSILQLFLWQVAEHTCQQPQKEGSKGHRRKPGSILELGNGQNGLCN